MRMMFVKLQDLIEVSKLHICSVFSVYSVVLKKSRIMERGSIVAERPVFLAVHRIKTLTAYRRFHRGG
jgi:hypothetical protein